MTKGFKKSLTKFKGKPQGTYDLDTGESLASKFGGTKAFQVSFQQTSDTYTDDEYDAKVNEIAKRANSKPYAGTYGEPEISFYCKDKVMAKMIMYEYNQYSIWDWENMCEEKNDSWDREKNSTEGN